MQYINTILKLYLFLIIQVSILLIFINYLLSPKREYFNLSKTAPFECGFDSFRQSRTTYSIQFILIAILFLPFDLELTSIFPYIISVYHLNIYGSIVLFYFLISLITGFILEINMKAIYIRKIFNNNYYRNI